MEFVWDITKAQTNFEKHGVHFDFAIKVFGDVNRVTSTDDRFDYGENRLLTFGLIDSRMYLVVHVDDDTAQTIRVISARKANRRERIRHGNG